MELVVSNAVSSRVRRETLNGRNYVVVPLTMIVPGVLNGSKGPMLYPADECAKDPQAWNGMPAVLYHPTYNDQPVTARDPIILEEHQIGSVYRADYDGELRSELWLDDELTKRRDQELPPELRLLPRIDRGENIEVSTGLYTDDHPAPAGATFNGVEYKFVARRYRPDHLAVLPDQTGACPVEAGCGIRLNTEGKPKETVVDRNGLMTFLTTNCDCYKGPEAKAFLEKRSDDDLRKLKDQVVSNRLVEAAKKGVDVKKLLGLVTNADGATDEVAPGISIADLATFLGVQADPASDPVAFIKEIQAHLTEIMTKLEGGTAEDAVDAGADDATETPAPAPTPTGNRKGKDVKTNQGPARPRTLKEFEESMPDEARAVWESAKAVEARERQHLVERIVTANSGGDAKAAANLRKIYGGMKMRDLQTVVASMPKRRSGVTANGRQDDDAGEFQPFYTGQGTPPYSPTTNAGDGPGDEDVLDLPTINFSRDDEDRDDEPAPGRRAARR